MPPQSTVPFCMPVVGGGCSSQPWSLGWAPRCPPSSSPKGPGQGIELSCCGLGRLRQSLSSAHGGFGMVPAIRHGWPGLGCGISQGGRAKDLRSRDRGCNALLFPTFQQRTSKQWWERTEAHNKARLHLTRPSDEEHQSIAACWPPSAFARAPKLTQEGWAYTAPPVTPASWFVLSTQILFSMLLAGEAFFVALIRIAREDGT